MSTTTKKAQNTLAVRELTKRVYDCIILDVWPSPACVVDFGIDSEQHYGALQFAIAAQGLTAEQLDDACGCGPALTDLITADNPYYGVIFRTSWDYIMVPIKSWAVVPEGNFSLGRLFARPDVLGVATKEEVNAALASHAGGDRRGGDAAADEDADRDGGEFSSRYRVASGGELCVKTSFNPPMTLVSVESEEES